MRLANQHAIITGAASGIGWATAELFIEHGATVSLLDTDPDRASELLQQLPAPASESAAVYGVDIADLADVTRCVSESITHFGNPSILVNCAATQTPAATIDELDPADWASAFSVNVTGTFNVSRTVIPAMRDNRGGSIVHVASQLGSVAMPGFSAYCATKGAILQLSKAMALDHAADNIRVNCVSPGATLTERLRKRFKSDRGAFEALGAGYPIGRLAEAREIAQGILYLSSSEASFVTGSDLLIDGGYLAR